VSIDERHKGLKAKDVATEIVLGAVSQQSVRDQLAILRQTRGQREVGTLKVPAHLQQPIVLTDAGVKERASRAGGDE
jgi:hypothetical protein